MSYLVWPSRRDYWLAQLPERYCHRVNDRLSHGVGNFTTCARLGRARSTRFDQKRAALVHAGSTQNPDLGTMPLHMKRGVLPPLAGSLPERDSSNLLLISPLRRHIISPARFDNRPSPHPRRGPPPALIGDRAAEDIDCHACFQRVAAAGPPRIHWLQPGAVPP